MAKKISSSQFFKEISKQQDDINERNRKKSELYLGRQTVKTKTNPNSVNVNKNSVNVNKNTVNTNNNGAAGKGSSFNNNMVMPENSFKNSTFTKMSTTLPKASEVKKTSYGPVSNPISDITPRVMPKYSDTLNKIKQITPGINSDVAFIQRRRQEALQKDFTADVSGYDRQIDEKKAEVSKLKNQYYNSQKAYTMNQAEKKANNINNNESAQKDKNVVENNNNTISTVNDINRDIVALRHERQRTLQADFTADVSGIDRQIKAKESELKDVKSKINEINANTKELKKSRQKTMNDNFGLWYEKLSGSGENSPINGKNKYDTLIENNKQQIAELKGSSSYKKELNYGKYLYMTDKEKQTYYTLLNSGQTDTAKEYMSFLERDLNKRATEERDLKTADDANKHKSKGVVNNITSSLVAGVGILGAGGQVLKNAVSGDYAPVDTNSGWYEALNTMNANAEGITRDMSPTGKFLTNTGLSIGQNVARMPLALMGMPNVALGIAGATAGAQTSKEITDRGGTAEQAFGGGLASAGIEALTEKVSLENLMNIHNSIPLGFEASLRAIGKQAIAEGSEEVASEYLNTLLDNSLMGSNSEYQQYISHLMEDGTSRKDAINKANMKFYFENPALAGLGGFISGGVMGGGDVAFNNASNTLSFLKKYKKISGISDTDVMVQNHSTGESPLSNHVQDAKITTNFNNNISQENKNFNSNSANKNILPWAFDNSAFDFSEVTADEGDFVGNKRVLPRASEVMAQGKNNDKGFSTSKYRKEVRTPKVVFTKVKILKNAVSENKLNNNGYVQKIVDNINSGRTLDIENIKNFMPAKENRQNRADIEERLGIKLPISGIGTQRTLNEYSKYIQSKKSGTEYGYGILRFGNDNEKYDYIKNKGDIGVTHVEGNEIINKGNVSDFVENRRLNYNKIRNKAIEWAINKGIIGDKNNKVFVKNNDTGMKIEMPKKAVTSGYGKGHTISQTKILPHLKSLMENAVEVSANYGKDERDYNDINLIATHMFLSAVEENGRVIPVKLTVKDKTTGVGLYSNLVLEKIEELAPTVRLSESNSASLVPTWNTSSNELAPTVGTPESSSADLPPTWNTSSKINISDLISKVKDEHFINRLPAKFFNDNQQNNSIVKNTGASQEDIKRVIGIGKSLGREVIFTDEENMPEISGKNGFYRNGRIFINKNCENPVFEVFKHELTHYIETSNNYKAFSQYVTDYCENTLGVDVEKYAEGVIELYAKNGVNIDKAQAYKEFVADFTGSELFTDEKAIKALADKKPQIVQNILDFITDIINRLKGQNTSELVKMQRSFKKALKTAKGSNSNIEYQIKKNEKGFYVKQDRHIELDEDTNKWEKQAIEYINNKILNNGELKVNTLDGDTLTINGRTAWKLGYRNVSAKDNAQMKESLYKKKLQAGIHIDEISRVSERGKEIIPDRKNHKFAKDGFNYRRAYFEDEGGDLYELKISVGYNGDVKSVYNIGKIQKKVNLNTAQNYQNDNVHKRSRFQSETGKGDKIYNSNTSDRISPSKRSVCTRSTSQKGTGQGLSGIANKNISQDLNNVNYNDITNFGSTLKKAGIDTDSFGDNKGNTEYSIKTDRYGIKYWNIDPKNDIFSDVETRKKLREKAYDYILNGDKGEKVYSIIDGKELEFRRISAKEYTMGRQSQGLNNLDYKKKMRMTPSVLDLIENSQTSWTAPDAKNHKMFPNGFQNYRGRVGIDNSIFDYIVRIGKTRNDGNVFYDINLETDGEVPSSKRNVSPAKVPSSKKNVSPVKKPSVSNNNLAQGKGNVNYNDITNFGSTLKKAGIDTDSFENKNSIGKGSFMEKVKNFNAVRAKTTTNEQATILTEVYKKKYIAKKNYERVLSKTILTDIENGYVNAIINGKTDISQIPKDLNVSGIKNVAQAKIEFDAQDNIIKSYNEKRKASLNEEAMGFINNSDNWKDFFNGFSISINTPENVMYGITQNANKVEKAQAKRNYKNSSDKEGYKASKADIDNKKYDEGKRLVEHYIKPIHENEAKSTKFKNDYRDRVTKMVDRHKSYHINIEDEKGKIHREKLSESMVIQLIGDGEGRIKYLQSQDKITKNQRTEINELQSEIENVKRQLSSAQLTHIYKAVDGFKGIYEQLYNDINKALVTNGFEPVRHIDNYFPHFIEEESDGIVDKTLKIFNIDKKALEALPTNISGETYKFKPGKKWVGNFLERTGSKTTYDAVKGFDRYIENVADVIYHTEDIQKLRSLEDALRYKYSSKGVQEEYQAIRANKKLSTEEMYKQLDVLRERNISKFPNFAKWLRNYTNNLAGKKSFEDRQWEDNLGRGIYEVSKKLEGRVAANMVAINPGSWLTNYIPITQAAAECKTINILRGMKATIGNNFKSDGMVDRSVFLTNREGSDSIDKTTGRQIADFMASPMNYIDQFTSGTVVRAKYFQNIKNGMSESEAMADADEFAQALMAGRSKGAMPTFFNAKNPVVKTFSMFQLEVNNQYQYLFKDLPRRKKDKCVALIAFGLMKMFLGAYLYNDIYEKLTGRRSALDPASIVNDAVGDFSGKKLDNTIDWIKRCYESGALESPIIDEKYQPKKRNAVLNIGKNIAQEVPFVGGLLGGGRVPVSSALPNIKNTFNAGANLFDDDKANDKKALGDLGGEFAKPLLYMGLPFGGGQIKKALEGFDTVRNGGAYSTASDGRKQLNFPVDKNGNWNYADDKGSFKEKAANQLEDIKNNPLPYAQAITFGRYSLPRASDYVDSGFKNLSADNTIKYGQALENGFTIDEILNTFDVLGKVDSREKKSGLTYNSTASANLKRKRIIESKLSDDKKAWVYDNLINTGYADRQKKQEAREAGVNINDIMETDIQNNMLSARFKNYVVPSGHVNGATLKADKLLEYIDTLGLDYDQRTALKATYIGKETATEDKKSFQKAYVHGVNVETFNTWKNKFADIDTENEGLDLNTDEINKLKRSALFKDKTLTANQKRGIENGLINDMTIIPKEVDADFSGDYNSFMVSQMSDAAQKKWSAAHNWGMQADDYIKYYAVVYEDGLKKEQKIQKMVKMGMTRNQAYTFWNIIKKK